MLSQKLLINVGVDLFASRNWLSAAKKSTRPALILLALLLLALCHSVRSTPSFNNFFTLKMIFLLLLRTGKSLCVAVPRKALSDPLRKPSSWHGAVYFLKLDLEKGFRQFPIAKDDIPKIAIHLTF
jgi:hypothetical protein